MVIWPEWTWLQAILAGDPDFAAAAHFQIGDVIGLARPSWRREYFETAAVEFPMPDWVRDPDVAS